MGTIIVVVKLIIVYQVCIGFNSCWELVFYAIFRLRMWTTVLNFNAWLQE